jgi:Ca2+-binding EF-hand superfamily protein
MKHRHTAILASTLLAVSIGSACAETTETPAQKEAYQRKLFGLIDTNHDDVVSEKEFSTYILREEFRLFDKNGDGKISKAEYLKTATDKEYYSTLDPSGKGHVTLEELNANTSIKGHLRTEWKKALKALNLGNAKVIKRSDLPDVTP